MTAKSKWFTALTAAFLTALLLCCARASALTLTVSYDTPTASAPMTFTMSSDGSDECKYSLNSVTRVYTDTNERVYIVDPSLGAYKTNYTKEKTVTIPLRTSGTYYLKFIAFDMGVTPYAYTACYVNFTIDEPEYPTAEALADEIAAQCLEECDTEYEKAVWLHDWLVRNSDYDYSYSFCSAEAALTKSKGTCESYHRAYEMLLNRVGIESSRVTGNGHVWTGVKLDGKWCQVDVTWDDMGDKFAGTYWEHLYFGLTDELMQAAHDEHTADASRPCDSLDNNWFLRTGAYTQWTDGLLEAMDPEPGAVRSAALSESTAPSTKAILYPIIMEALRRNPDIEEAYVEDDRFVCRFAYKNAVPPLTKIIEEYAFEGSRLASIDLPYGLVTIEQGAFRNSALKRIRIPSSVTAIAADAFEGTSDLTIICPENSAAHTFAKAHGITCITDNSGES